MRKYLIAVAVLTAAVSSGLGTAQGADRPAPTGHAPAVAFGSLTTIYVASGVRDDGGGDNAGAATTFHCSNVSGVAAQIRFPVLNFNGVTAANITVTVGNGITHTKSTHGTAITEDLPHLSPGTAISQGVVAIHSTQSAVFCNAQVVDAANPNVAGDLHLVRVNADPNTVE